MNTLTKTLVAGMSIVALTACTTPSDMSGKYFPTADQAVASSWQNVPANMAGRLVQDDTQNLCSQVRDQPDAKLAERIEKMNLALPVKYPANGQLMGDWKKGEALAQSGYGMRVGDSLARHPVSLRSVSKA